MGYALLCAGLATVRLDFKKKKHVKQLAATEEIEVDVILINLSFIL